MLGDSMNPFFVSSLLTSRTPAALVSTTLNDMPRPLPSKERDEKVEHGPEAGSSPTRSLVPNQGLDHSTMEQGVAEKDKQKEHHQGSQGNQPVSPLSKFMTRDTNDNENDHHDDDDESEDDEPSFYYEVPHGGYSSPPISPGSLTSATSSSSITSWTNSSASGSHASPLYHSRHPPKEVALLARTPPPPRRRKRQHKKKKQQQQQEQEQAMRRHSTSSSRTQETVAVPPPHRQSIDMLDSHRLVELMGQAGTTSANASPKMTKEPKAPLETKKFSQSQILQANGDATREKTLVNGSPKPLNLVPPAVVTPPGSCPSESCDAEESNMDRNKTTPTSDKDKSTTKKKKKKSPRSVKLIRDTPERVCKPSFVADRVLVLEQVLQENQNELNRMRSVSPCRSNLVFENDENKLTPTSTSENHKDLLLPRTLFPSIESSSYSLLSGRHDSSILDLSLDSSSSGNSNNSSIDTELLDLDNLEEEQDDWDEPLEIKLFACSSVSQGKVNYHRRISGASYGEPQLEKRDSLSSGGSLHHCPTSRSDLSPSTLFSGRWLSCS